MTKEQELLRICDAESIKWELLESEDPFVRANLKGKFLAYDMYTNDIRFFLGKRDFDGLKKSLTSKDIEMNTFFPELILCSDPITEERLRSQIVNGLKVRKMLLEII